MDELVRKILNIENRANRMIEAEKQRLSDLPKDVEAILDAKKREMDEKSQQRIDRIAEAESEDERVRLEKSRQEFSESSEKLSMLVEQNKEKWIEEILKRITSR